MANALSRFGNYCRDLRARNSKTMGDQADALGIDVTLISAIETGGKLPPEHYIERISNWLNLSEREAAELTKRKTAAVIAFPGSKYVGKNSNSMRLFRKISKMNPDEIRSFRTKGRNEAYDDGRSTGQT